MVGLFTAEMAGLLWLGVSDLLAAAAGLALVWVALVGLSVKLFDRETILTRWT